MLRSVLVGASHSRLLRRVATDVPAARRVARRFVAGETLDEAVSVAGALDAAGRRVSLDYLGEAVSEPEVARRASGVYCAAVDRIEQAGLAGAVSVKLTQLGLGVSRALCAELLATVAERAAAAGQHVTVDMEGSDHTGDTVELVLELRRSGHDNLGCAVQSYLYRTPHDVERLVASGTSLRLCKGAYAEPPEVAHPDKRDVDAAYLRLAERLLASDTFPRFATHDHRLIERIRNLAVRHRVPADRYELQMLYGFREPLQQRLVARGAGLRVYVPFGDQWYPYLTRRLAERPANLLFFLRALAGRRTE